MDFPDKSRTTSEVVADGVVNQPRCRHSPPAGLTNLCLVTVASPTVDNLCYKVVHVPAFSVERLRPRKVDQISAASGPGHTSVPQVGPSKLVVRVVAALAEQIAKI